MNIIPKLYLNGSPQSAEDGSLAFAKNMKLDDDGNLVNDYGYENITALDYIKDKYANFEILGQIVGLNNKIYIFGTGNVKHGDIVELKQTSIIIEYDEVEKTATEIQSAWKYSGGSIDGYVSTNISGEVILTIAEHIDGDSDIPLKHINLSYCKANDNESIYCQAPEVPITNLILKDTYTKTIPNGVYVFFIRYKIRKDVYTPWYLCSHPSFAGVSEEANTIQGGVKYINLHKDSGKSFVFSVNHINTSAKSLYSEFQLGFIITHDEATDARIWKSFDIETEEIYFDYDEIEETNIDDLLAVTYELYNVGNITSFKNKLYISNYIETNFNNEIYKNIVNKLNIRPFATKYIGGKDDTNNTLTVGDGFVFNWNEEKGYFDSYTSEKIVFETLSDYIKSQFIKRDNVNYIIDSSLPNATTVNFSDAAGNKIIAQFKFDWSSNKDPDIAIACRINDKTIGAVPFGNFDYSWEEAYDKCLRTAENTFRPWLVYPNTNNLHPWHNKGYTYAFGSGISERYSNSKCYHSRVYRMSKDYLDIRFGIPCWFAENGGFKQYAEQTNHMFNVVTSELQQIHNAGICYIVIYSGAKKYTIGYNNIMELNNFFGYDYNGKSIIMNIDHNELNNGTISDDLKEKLTIFTNTNICKAFAGVNASGQIMVKATDSDGNDDIIPITNVNCVVKHFHITCYESIDSAGNNTNEYEQTYTYQFSTYTREINVSVSFKPTFLSVEEVTNTIFKKKSSLMPCSQYKVYVHFVDIHNIISNGFYVNTINTLGVYDRNVRLLKDYKDEINIGYKFTQKPIVPNNIKAMFFSIVPVGKIIVQGFNYSYNSSTRLNILHSIELDALLYNLTDNITICCTEEIYLDNGLIKTIKLKEITNTAKYYSSGNSNVLAFGNCGYISWSGNEDLSDKTLYIKIERKSSDKNNILTKATPYLQINEYVYDTWTLLKENEGFYNSYLCSVKKPDFETSSSSYVSGNDIYKADRNSTYVKLTEFDSFVNMTDSRIFNIRSNFNLNFLTLYEDVADKIISIANNSQKQVVKLLNSSILSFIYELKPMYKDFMNKTFMPAEELYKTKFDNTIKVSNVLSDETFNNSIFKFEATNYYNIPADRGIIVKLFAIGNNIYVHTKNSFYKFDATHTITSTESDIKLQESEPFEVGITQIFDSQYGYGGINNKEAGCITFDSYFFYDVNSKHIFSYGGTGQIKLIDGSINKFINYYSPKYCRAIHDEFNKRILFNFYGDVEFTLSYNYKSNSFVSFHDLTLDKAFYSRTGIYTFGIYRTTTDENTILTKLFKTTSTIKSLLYGVATKKSDINYKYIIQDEDAKDKYAYGNFNISVICFPKQYLIEVLNYISYVANVITDTNKNNIIDLSIDNKILINPVKALTINTDSCASTVIKSTVNDKARPNTLLDYKGFKYNKGFWNTNYFRNYKHIQNVYDYPKVIGGDGNNISDNQSLIYGRYFLLNFDFIDAPIKIESIQINTQNY